MNPLFTADTHFNHRNIIEHCHRPWASVYVMNEYLINAWNSVVRPEDLVYHLGDFAWPEGKLLFSDIHTPRKILGLLNGRKILITGSHDSDIIRTCSDLFEEITPLKDIKINGQHVVLCHYAMRRWPRSHHGAWHLYAHSHGELEPLGKSWDAGVDNNNYYPLSWDQVVAIMAGREENPENHGGKDGNN